MTKFFYSCEKRQCNLGIDSFIVHSTWIYTIFERLKTVRVSFESFYHATLKQNPWAPMCGTIFLVARLKSTQS